MDWIAVIGSLIALVVSFGTLGKLLSESRRAHRQDEERRREKQQQLEAERQLADIVKKLQEPDAGGFVVSMASPDLAGAELGIRLGVLFGFWDKGNRCFRLATKDDVKELVEKRAQSEEERHRGMIRAQELAQTLADDTKRAWWAEMKRQSGATEGPLEIPTEADPAWVIEGEALGYFRRLRHPDGHWMLLRA